MSLSLAFCLYLSTAIFCIGVYGILSRQNIIIILMSLELMLNAVNLALVSFGRYFIATPAAEAAAQNAGIESAVSASTPQAFVVIVLAVAAAEAAVGLAILLSVYRRWRSANAGEIQLLSG